MEFVDLAFLKSSHQMAVQMSLNATGEQLEMFRQIRTALTEAINHGATQNYLLHAIRRVMAEQITRPANVQQEREAFEEFMRVDTTGFTLEREGDSYKEFEVATYWHFWWARAAIPTQNSQGAN